MKKLYEKNELIFAIVTIAVYVVLMGNLRGNFGDDSLISAAGLLAIAALLTGFILKNGLIEKYGFIRPANAKGFLYFIPFALLCTVNLWFGIRLHYSPAGQIAAVVNMALVGYVEEVIFRGLLFRAIEKQNLKEAFIISAVTFGAGHIVNLLTGHGTMETVLQILYAIAIGLSFVLVFHQGGSLIPCILTHSFINMGSVFSNHLLPEDTARLYEICGATFIILIAGAYSLYLLKARRLRTE